MSTFITTQSNQFLDANNIPELGGDRTFAQVVPHDYQPRRFGLRYNPPMIVLEYLVPSTGKLFHHKMRLRNLTHDSDCKDLTDYLFKRHEPWLKGRVSNPQIEDLVSRLQKRMKPAELAQPKGGPSHFQKESEEVKKEYSKLHDQFDYDNTNLNKLSDLELKKHKEQMESVFEKNNKKPGDKDFVYDIEVDFSKKEKKDSGWDDDFEDFDEDDDDFDF